MRDLQQKHEELLKKPEATPEREQSEKNVGLTLNDYLKWFRKRQLTGNKAIF
jgi:hypothetical protein